MAKKPKKAAADKQVESLRYQREDATRKNIPTAEYRSVLERTAQDPVRVGYERRNRDLDPQLVWRGKDEQDWSDLVVQAPPLYIQEKVHPKALIDDLLRQTREARHEAGVLIPDLFADFNGIPSGVDKTEFYRHDQNWSNRMILGDSLQVMASLAEREGLRGKVQCIYIDPPYGIKFNSNFQWSTTSRDVKDGNAAHITREPEQVKAFRDTWRDGIHSYLTYLRDRLTVARDLLTDSGSIFVQIGDENVHRVRALMDEVFGEDNFIAQIEYQDVRRIYWDLSRRGCGLRSMVCSRFGAYEVQHLCTEPKSSARTELTSTGVFGCQRSRHDRSLPLSANGADVSSTRCASLSPRQPHKSERRSRQGRGCRVLVSGAHQWPGGTALRKSALEDERIWHGDGFFGPTEVELTGESLSYVRFLERLCGNRNQQCMDRYWTAFKAAQDPKVYVVQTQTHRLSSAASSCRPTLAISCSTPPAGPARRRMSPSSGGGGGSPIDTSRVALALARARIMGARYPYYLLADSREGQLKEAEVTRTAPSSQPTHGRIRQGFVYERVPHITLKSIANNAEIDVIWDKWQATLEPLREKLNAALKQDVAGVGDPAGSRSEVARRGEAGPRRWWAARIGRQKEIDASIAAKAEFEYLYDKPYEDRKKVRVAGPFTVESLSPHRVLGVGENDELIDTVAEAGKEYGARQSFPEMILDNLRAAGVQQAHKDARIVFTALTPWPGSFVAAEGRYIEGEGAGAVERRAAIFIGPEFGTVTRPDLVEAAREAGDANFDVLIACAFNYEAHATEFNKLGRIPVLKARMNADLHMAEDLKNTGQGNLFVIFGEPDITVTRLDGGRLQVKVNGVDVFHPGTGEVRSDGPDGIACWFIDTDYNGESFFVRHAYFLGANDPYGALKTTLRAEIDEAAWATLHSDTSRPFDRPTSGRIAVKVINHLGDEVMKVFRVV